MKQKTAIEFLSEKILEVIGDSGNSFTITQTLKMHYAFKEAKDKFREQIEEANNSGWQDGFKRKMVTSGKVYYQQKYGDEPTIKND